MHRSFDDWKTSAPDVDDDRPAPCPVCTGDETAVPCSEACAELVAARTYRVVDARGVVIARGCGDRGARWLASAAPGRSVEAER